MLYHILFLKEQNTQLLILLSSLEALRVKIEFIQIYLYSKNYLYLFLCL
jgi:hypothetical protein